MRRLAATLSLILAVCLAAPAAADTGAVVLRGSAAIDGDVIRLGDLFDNVGEKAGTVVTHAPQPGRRIVLDAQWLATVANAHGIAWRPLGRAERLVVERRSTTIGVDEIAVELRRALEIEGVDPGAELQLANRSLQIHLPVDAAPRIEVRDLDYDRRTGRFAAAVEISGGAGPQRARVSGRVFSMTEVPVLARAMNRGEVIGEGDIEWMPLREARLARGVVTDTDQLVGKELRHPARAGQPLRANDVQAPVVVARNSMVTMILRTGGLSLTAQGRAVEDGSQGAVIRVTNTHSNVTVEAKVEGPGVVSVMPAGHVLAN